MKLMKKSKNIENLIKMEIKNLHEYLKKHNVHSFRQVINVKMECICLVDNKGNKIFYNQDTNDWKIKCRIKCIKDDNAITFLDKPLFMDLFAQTKRDVLAIINSRM